MLTSRVRSRPYIAVGLLALVLSGPAWLSGCAQVVRSQTPEVASEEPPAPPTFAPGTVAAGVDIGGTTHERAGHLIRHHLKSLENRPITLFYGQREFPRTWKDLGVRPDDEAMLREAWSAPEVPLIVSVDLGQAKRSIRRAAPALDVKPVAPRFSGEPAKSPVKPGKAGRAVNVHNSAVLLQSALAADPMATRAPLKVAAVEPDFSVADLEAIRRPVVRFSTRFNPGERSRTHNLRLVSQRLNGALIRPGQTFSFNEWVGERRPEDGFQEAIVFKQGKMVQGTAGGLCQVSSTLYNVALLAGLPIVERRNHSLPVGYVPPGRDATVYWGQIDLRFRNDTEMPLYLRSSVGKNTLTIEAWGAEELDRKVEITSQSNRKGDKTFAQAYRSMVKDGIRTREKLSSDVYTKATEPAPAPKRADRR